MNKNLIKNRKGKNGKRNTRANLRSTNTVTVTMIMTHRRRKRKNPSTPRTKSSNQPPNQDNNDKKRNKGTTGEGTILLSPSEAAQDDKFLFDQLRFF